jgi:hypothetical protein
MPDRQATPRNRRLAVLCLVAVCLLLQPGCVRRRLMVRSNPPGALVYVDNQLVGTTPCATDFTYYGTREVRLVKSGYETVTRNQPIPAPWYEIPPLDFISENLVPRKIQDFRTVSFEMTPQVIVPTEQLLNRAEQLRQSTQQGAVLPPNPELIAPTTGQPLDPAQGTPQGLAPVNPSPTPGSTLPPSGQPLQPLQ